jgi:beta-lactamase superfamily II metal-dependent hydrolase
VGSAGTVSRLRATSPLVRAPGDLVVYVLNVGDGDAIVIEFPQDAAGNRVHAVVDAFMGGKVRDFLRNELGATHLRFVCATHPHWDHIRGLPQVLTEFAGEIDAFWDSGFRYASTSYRAIIEQVGTEAAAGRMSFIRPTSGFEIEVSGVRVTVLSPSIALRNRYDTYGVDVNNASVVIRLEYPILPTKLAYPNTDDKDKPIPEPIPATRTRSMILGGDAQTDAWSRIVEEFPHLVADPQNWARKIGAQTGRQPLACDAFKVSHHASKNGVNLELIDRMGEHETAGLAPNGPAWLLTSCATGASSNHGFPHDVTQEIIREVREPLARKRKNDPTLAHVTDENLGILYTSSSVANTNPPTPAGSMAVVFDSAGNAPVVHRLMDATGAVPRLANARVQQPPTV